MINMQQIQIILELKKCLPPLKIIGKKIKVYWNTIFNSKF
jgi:hypothetical protein